MSERLQNAKEVRNVDHAFDPEARAAQSDWEDYLDGRNYKDENDRIHDAKTGRFTSSPNNESEEDYYNRLQDESEAEGPFAGKSLKEIAEMVRDARANDDVTMEIDARDAFDAKFIETAEKYNWQGKVESSDGSITDRDAIADSKLAYYESIMSQTVSESSQRSEASSETTQSSDQIAENDTVGTDSESDSEPIEGMGLVDAFNDELEQQSAAQEGESLEEYEERMGVTPTQETTTPNSGAEDLQLFDLDNETQDSTREFSADDLTLFENDSNATELEEDEPTVKRTRMQRLRDATTSLAGASTEVSRLRAAASARFERNGNGRRNRILAGLGGAALLIGGGLLMFKGHDIFSHGHGSSHTGGGAGREVVPTIGGDGGGSQAAAETIRVNPGDGEIKVMQHLLADHGIHVNAADAQRIGEHANLHDILGGDHSYAHSGSTMDRIGNTGVFNVRHGVSDKAVAAAHELGF